MVLYLVEKRLFMFFSTKVIAKHQYITKGISDIHQEVENLSNTLPITKFNIIIKM